MKKSVKILLVVMMVAMLVASFTVVASAQDTVSTHTEMYIGDWEGRDAHIVFGTVTNSSAGYGVIIENKDTGLSYAYAGKAIGAEGKFGIAVYGIEDGGNYVAYAYMGDPEDGVYGEEVSFVAGKSEYTVNFYGADDTIVKTETVAHGTSATAPEVDPFKVSYWFNGYDKDFTHVYADMDVKPVFETSDGVEGLKVYKDKDEDFKILNLADIQIINPNTENGAEQVSYYPHYGTPDESAWNVVKDLVAVNKPDMIVLNGDNIYSKFDDSNKTMHKTLAALLDSFHTPWTIIFGNHDGEIPSDTDFLLTDLVEIYSQSDYFYFESEADREYGDFAISLVNKGTDEVVMKYFFMYTHYNSGWFNVSQVEWYEEEVSKLNNGVSVIPSFLFAHIPLPELQDALIEKYHSEAVYTTSGSNKVLDYVHVPENNDGDFGEYNGAGYSKNYGMYDLMKEYGSTQLAIFGHEHSNNVSVDYNGVRLMFAMKTGVYAIDDPNTHLNGGTVMNIKADGTGYSLTNDHYTDRSLNYTYDYDFNLEAPAKEEGIGYLKATGDDAVVSGSKKITLAEGESASLSFDVYSSVIYHNSEKNASNPARDDGSSIIQMGLKVQTTAITGAWQGNSNFFHWMVNGPAAAWTQTGNVQLPTYRRGDTENFLFHNGVEEVFGRGRSVKYTVYADKTVKIFTKLAEEGEDKWVELAYGQVTVDISNGFYMGFQTTRSMKFKNFKITGNSYIINYNNVSCTFTSLDEFDSYKVTYDDGNASATHHGSFFAGEAIKLASASDTMSIEFTMITPPSIDSANLASFAVVRNIPTAWIDTSVATDYFWVYWNHVYMTKSGAGIVSDSVENSFFDKSLVYEDKYVQWSGAYFFKSLIRYKFELKGDKTFTISAKNGLDLNAEYEVVYAGTVADLNLDNEYYVGFIFHNNMEIMDLVINGESDISKLNINNATLTKTNA